MKFLVCVALLAVVPSAFSATWSYLGANNRTTWHLIPGSYCNGTRQSPIDIVTNVAVPTNLGTFNLNGYTSNNPNMDMDNNGHGITVRLHEDVEQLYNLSGGGLPTTYTATQFHFHWGSDDTQGSEHLVDGRAYPAELHMVHYDRSKYANLVEALLSLEWDAVTVLGLFIEIGDVDNAAFDNFMRYINQISNYSSGNTALGQGNLPSFSLRSLFPFDLSRFYRYNGSLTVPKCYESVIWTVFEDTISISQSQIDVFRAVLGDQVDGNGNYQTIVNNYRLTSPLYDRTIYYSSGETRAPTPTTPESSDDGGGAVIISPVRSLFIIALALHFLFNFF